MPLTRLPGRPCRALVVALIVALGLGLLAAPVPAGAQQAANVYRIGVLYPGSAAKKERAGALNVLASLLLASYNKTIGDLAAKNRLPAIYQWREHAEGGGLVSYGPVLLEMWRLTALVVGKVLKGAKPVDLPVEQPTRFELVINLKTAKALGVTIPQSILIRADHVIR